MPAQEGIRLDNQQSLFPLARLAGQQHKQRAVAQGEFRSLHLPLQHDELLTQQCVLHHQFRLAACQVKGGTLY